MARPKQRRPKGNNYRERDRLESIDQARKLMAFKESLPKYLLDDITGGLGPDEIMKKYEVAAVARLIHILNSEEDSTKALNAAREILDRVQGKPTQKQEVKHRYEKLKDDELDSVLDTLLEEDDEKS